MRSLLGIGLGVGVIWGFILIFTIVSGNYSIAYNYTYCEKYKNNDADTELRAKCLR